MIVFKQRTQGGKFGLSDGGRHWCPPAESAHHLVKFIDLQMIAQKITRNELARRSGVPKTAMKEWFRGRREPGLRKIMKVLAALGYDVKPVPIREGKPHG
ncbi:MAG: helix-turn-helix transcriptional regulator [Patescibacteria group bacterium]|nr:helix-turn-helix transcriptional regulator [Patescibacteria group bacterium]